PRVAEAPSGLEPCLRARSPRGTRARGRPRPHRQRARGWRGAENPARVRHVAVSRTAGVVIVGGGVTGTSIAFHLAGLGVRDVLLLERNTLASGGTGRSVGIVRQLYPTPETTRMVVRSLEVFRRFGEAVGGDSGYVACGCLIGVGPAMRRALEASVARQRTLGVKAEVLNPEDVARVEPRID